MKLALKRATTGFRILKFIEGVGEVFPVYKLKPLKILREIGIGSLDAPLRDSASIFKVPRPKGRIAVFAGCTANFLYPGIGRALIRSLNALSYEVILPKGEACCGAPLRGLGLENGAVQLAERNMQTFKRMKVEAVIGLCPTCVHFIKNEYKGLIGDSIENAMEVSQFFNDKLQVINNIKGSNEGPLRVMRHSSPGVVYHDPCHSIYSLNVSAEPRRILRAMGLNLIDAERGCCGFGGTFRLLYQDLSESILQKRVEGYRKADMIVTSCPNCMIQLRSRVKDRQVKHIIELIEQAVQGDRDEKER
jgi:glycolate oxidase iron-sulfur subunit